MLYRQLIQFDEKDDASVCKVANTPKEAQALVENGFDYLCTLDGVGLFRKLKSKCLGLMQNDVEMPRAGFGLKTAGDYLPHLSPFSSCDCLGASLLRAMSSLAGYLRELAERGTYDQNDIVKKYESWVLEDRYMVLAHERQPWLSRPGEWEYD